jgi:hypothetical protein
MARPNQPPVHPLGPVFLALVAIVVLGASYWAFGVGKDALLFATAVLIFFAFPVVVLFGVAGIVVGLRRLFRRS